MRQRRELNASEKDKLNSVTGVRQIASAGGQIALALFQGLLGKARS